MAGAPCPPTVYGPVIYNYIQKISVYNLLERSAKQFLGKRKSIQLEPEEQQIRNQRKTLHRGKNYEVFVCGDLICFEDKK